MESKEINLNWNLSGAELKRLIYEAGFTSSNSFARYFDLPSNTVWRWSRMDVVPRGRLIAHALEGRILMHRLERESKAVQGG